jgi:hypothetical protein
MQRPMPFRNITNSYIQPANGSQKLIEVEDERKLRVFMDKRYAYRVSNCTET